MSNGRSPHFREEYLIRYVDGELKKHDAAQVQEHLEACWRCRAVLADLQQTIADYVSCLDESNEWIPDPPQPWSGFQAQLDRLAARRQVPWWRRAGGTLVGFLSAPRMRLASIGATILLIALVTVFELNRPVRAAELLSRASAHEAATSAPRRGILIRMRNRSFTRPAILTPGSANDPQSDVSEEIRALFQSAAYSWDNPLSASSFAAWRDRLPDRSDNVDEIGTGSGLKVFRIRTSTSSSVLEEATLSFRTDNYGVVSGAFRFRDNSWIEMELTPVLPEAVSPAAPEPSPAAAAPPAAPPAEAPRPASPAIDRSVQELRVFAALRDIGADLGEQIDFTWNDQDKLEVSATGLPPNRREALQRALAAISAVDLHFVQPGPVRSSDLSGRASGPDTASAPSPLQLRIGRAIGGPAMERFTDRVLETSARAAARAHALRKLAERFPPQVESHFDSGNYATLIRLRGDHMDALLRAVEEIQRIVEPVFASLGIQSREIPQSPPRPANWQAATQTMLDATSRADRFLTMIVTGTGVSPQENLLADAADAVRQLAAETASDKSIVTDAAQGRH